MGKGRAPCCEKVGLKKGSWTPAEDMRLVAYIQKYGHGNWRALPKQAGLLRCGKSCRLRWINYLRPDIKRGNFTKEEEDTIIRLHQMLGNKWSKIASRLPGRTDNEIKNVWNTHLKKRLASREENPSRDRSEESPRSPNSNSSLSCCNQASVDGVKDGSIGIVPTDEEISKACDESLSEDIIEIPIEANLDMWDVLEVPSPHSDITSNTEDKAMWNVDWDKEFTLQQPLKEEPTKGSLSTSSSFSDITFTNFSEGGLVETVPLPSAQPAVDAVGRIPDILIEPELWKFFEDDVNLFDDIPKGIEEEEPKNEVENGEWIAYLEKELELPGLGDGPPTHESPAITPVQPPDPGKDQGEGGAPNLEMDPIATYFQRQHPSSSPLSLSFADVSMT